MKPSFMIPILLSILLFTLTGCTVTKPDYEDTLSAEDKANLGIGDSKIGGGDGFLQLGNKKDSVRDSTNLFAGGTVQVNRYLWSASLDIIAFMPLSQVDAVGGVILTEWHALPESPNERYKVNIIITGTQLRPDALQVKLFKQKGFGNNWQDIAISGESQQQLFESILTRAREIRFFSLGQKG